MVSEKGRNWRRGLLNLIVMVDTGGWVYGWMGD